MNKPKRLLLLDLQHQPVNKMYLSILQSIYLSINLEGRRGLHREIASVDIRNDNH